jgi:hypothetical protein
MEFYTKDQPHGVFHKLKSSFNEIFGRPETGTTGIKKFREEAVRTDPKKSDSVENK